jgi:hypothetical protein
MRRLKPASGLYKPVEEEEEEEEEEEQQQQQQQQQHNKYSDTKY